MRQASFVSLRDDKPARQIVKEEPASAKKVASKTAAKKTPVKKTPAEKTPAEKTATKARTSSAEIEGVKISHPDRVIDKSTGLRKIDVVEYYASVADWMLPHLKDRPVSLVRAPEDIGGELFFQKHSAKLAIPHITQHPDIDPGHPPLLTIESSQALVGTA